MKPQVNHVGFLNAYCNWCQKITGGSARAYAVFDMGKVNYSGGAISEFVDKNTEHGFKMINRFCSSCGSPVEMHVERVPDGQFVPLGTIDQRHSINLNEGLWESLHYRMLLSKMGVKSESKVEAVI
jgi:hypothetical protein